VNEDGSLLALLTCPAREEKLLAVLADAIDVANDATDT
jgi:hypothetical protein